MEVSCQVDTSGMEAACLALAKVSGKSLAEVVDSELTAILNTTIDRIPAASVKKITNRYAKFVPMGMDSYSPRRVRRYGGSSGSNIIYCMDNRYPNQLWALLKSRRADLIAKKKRARGLSKKSFWTIGQMLGLKVKGGEFVKAIPASGNEHRENFQARRRVTDTDISVEFINAQPSVNSPYVGGGAKFQTAMNGRVKFFIKNAELGVLDSLEKVAAQYPGLKIAKV